MFLEACPSHSWPSFTGKSFLRNVRTVGENAKRRGSHSREDRRVEVGKTVVVERDLLIGEVEALETEFETL